MAIMHMPASSAFDSEAVCEAVVVVRNTFIELKPAKIGMQRQMSCPASIRFPRVLRALPPIPSGDRLACSGGNTNTNCPAASRPSRTFERELHFTSLPAALGQSFEAAAHGLGESQDSSRESKSLVDEVVSTTGRVSSYHSFSGEEFATHGLGEPQDFSRESKPLVDEVVSTTGRVSSYHSFSGEEFAAHGLGEPQDFSRESKPLVDEVGSTTGRIPSYHSSFFGEEFADTFDAPTFAFTFDEASGSESDTVEAMRENGIPLNPSSESCAKKQEAGRGSEAGASAAAPPRYQYPPAAATVAADSLEHSEQFDSNTGAKIIRPQGPIFQKEAFKLVDEVAVVLRQTFGAEVRIGLWDLAGKEGCITFIVVIKPQDFARLKYPIEKATREGILKGCSRTRGVCLLGFKEEPFLESRDGFSATFASVPSNAKRECRRLYRHGNCQGGPRCKFEHPTSVMHLDFTIARA